MSHSDLKAVVRRQLRADGSWHSGTKGVRVACRDARCDETDVLSVLWEIGVEFRHGARGKWRYRLAPIAGPRVPRGQFVQIRERHPDWVS